MRQKEGTEDEGKMGKGKFAVVIFPWVETLSIETDCCRPTFRNLFA